MPVRNKSKTEAEREALINENYGLVRAAAYRFSGRGIDYDDLYQAGCIGLIKAADGFEPERGLRFSTYAVPAIFGEIKRLFRDGGQVKVGRTLKRLSLTASRERENFCKANGREPTVGELAQRLGVSAEEAAEAVGAGAPTLSLTAEDDDGESSQTDLPVAFPEEAITDRMALAQALTALEKGDRELIIMRYFNNMTQSAAALRLGMTQVQVSRREKKILRQLRELLK